jgi:hypothetical protein
MNIIKDKLEEVDRLGLLLLKLRLASQVEDGAAATGQIAKWRHYEINQD